MFGCIPKNDLENILQCLVVLLKMLQKTYFYHVSHIFLGSKQILLQKIKIYKQHKKQKSKQKNQNHKTNCERGTERDRFMGLTRHWTRWVDLKVVGRSRSGSLIGWVDRFVVRSEMSACERGWRVPCERGVSEVISTFSLFHSLSLFLHV